MGIVGLVVGMGGFRDQGLEMGRFRGWRWVGSGVSMGRFSGGDCWFSGGDG